MIDAVAPGDRVGHHDPVAVQADGVVARIAGEHRGVGPAAAVDGVVAAAAGDHVVVAGGADEPVLMGGGVKGDGADIEIERAGRTGVGALVRAERHAVDDEVLDVQRASGAEFVNSTATLLICAGLSKVTV